MSIQPDTTQTGKSDSRPARPILGVLLVLVGLVALAVQTSVFDWLDLDRVWPYLIIALGVALYLLALIDRRLNASRSG